MPPSISGTLLSRFAWTYHRAAGAMLTTTATTAVSLFISGLSVFPMVRSRPSPPQSPSPQSLQPPSPHPSPPPPSLPQVAAFGLFNMFIVICDYLLVITWFAATTLCLEQLASKACPPGRNWECSCCCPGKAQEEKRGRRSSAWFRDTLAWYTFKARWVLIAISLATLAGGIVICSTKFEDGELANLPLEHPGWAEPPQACS